MRYWQMTWGRLLNYSQVNPFGFIEVLMLSLAIVLLLVWGMMIQWPYLVLSLSYGIGAGISVLIRSAYFAPTQRRLNQITAIAIILFSLWGFTDLWVHH
jgi:hypothetical protein